MTGRALSARSQDVTRCVRVCEKGGNDCGNTGRDRCMRIYTRVQTLFLVHASLTHKGVIICESGES